MADRLQAGWRSRQNSARLQTDGGEKPGEGRSSEIGCDEDGRPQNPVNLSALRHSGRGNAERRRREAGAASCNRPEGEDKEGDQRVRTFKAHSKQRLFMEFSREHSGRNRLNSKERNVARDRIELPTRGFSVLLPHRDYVSYRSLLVSIQAFNGGLSRSI